MLNLFSLLCWFFLKCFWKEKNNKVSSKVALENEVPEQNSVLVPFVTSQE